MERNSSSTRRFFSNYFSLSLEISLQQSMYAEANDMVRQLLHRGRFRGSSTWREALSRKQSRLLAEFLRKNSASKQKRAIQDSDIEVQVQTSLSHDLLYQIFMLLPADSLFRLQFVCKQWFSLINSPNFVTAHAKKSETGFISQQLSFLPQGLKGKPKSYFHFFRLDDWGSNFVEARVGDLGSVRASYDGLILASGGKRKRLVFMNPITGKYIELPLGAPSHRLCESFSIAFCREAKTYKVVHLFRETLGSIGCEIISICTRSWRRIEGPTELLRTRQVPVSIGGTLYWLSSIRGRDYYVSMDVFDEKFVSKKLPVKRGGNDRLIEIGGKLGFVTHVEVNVLQVWILVDEVGGSSECWMKRCSIDVDSGFAHCVPICSRRNGEEIVLECMGNHLYVYNLEREEMKLVNSGCDDEPSFGKINRFYLPHCNTLVSCSDQSLINGCNF